MRVTKVGGKNIFQCPTSNRTTISSFYIISFLIYRLNFHTILDRFVIRMPVSNDFIRAHVKQEVTRKKPFAPRRALLLLFFLFFFFLSLRTFIGPATISLFFFSHYIFFFIFLHISNNKENKRISHKVKIVSQIFFLQSLRLFKSFL